MAHSPLNNPLLWLGFVAFMLLATVVDLGLGRRQKAMTARAALTWCAVWIALALAFNVGIYFHPDFGRDKAEEFFAGYLLEKSLSVDNLFVFVLVFAYFRTPLRLQHIALVWGILGAMFLRAVMILSGAALIARFEPIMAIFGGFLLFSGIKLLFQDEDDDVSQSRLVRFLQARLPLIDDYRGERFFVREGGRRCATRLFLVLLVIEGSDVVFAVDSVPAIFGVTRDPFIVFTSNMFAILGLRALYFAIAGAIQKLSYLKYGLSLILAFIGCKMLAPFLPPFLHSMGLETGLAPEDLHLSTLTSLGIICGVLGATAVLSLAAPPRGTGASQEGSPLPDARDAIEAASPEEGS
ncbi:MAG: TerC family protein [Planctomycetota bacterium]|nr:MAG: TerC family protein [Planctomycetota bacterium]